MLPLTLKLQQDDIFAGFCTLTLVVTSWRRQFTEVKRKKGILKYGGGQERIFCIQKEEGGGGYRELICFSDLSPVLYLNGNWKQVCVHMTILARRCNLWQSMTSDVKVRNKSNILKETTTSGTPGGVITGALEIQICLYGMEENPLFYRKIYFYFCWRSHEKWDKY